MLLADWLPVNIGYYIGLNLLHVAFMVLVYLTWPEPSKSQKLAIEEGFTKTMDDGLTEQGVSMSEIPIILSIVVFFLILTLAIGEIDRRKTKESPEDFFMASRSFGTLVLLFALLATNMTAFVMVGVPGNVFSLGVGTYGWGAIFFLTFPVIFSTMGYRLWLTGKKFGHITPGDLFSHRYESKNLGIGVMLIMAFWTIPYLVIGAQGSGEAFAGLTNGVIPYWAGALSIMAIVGIYVYFSGMRGTGWANTFQGIVMIVFLWLLLIFLGINLGGFHAASSATMSLAPELASRLPVYDWQFYFSWIVVFLFSTIMSPHMFQRILPGYSIATLKRVALLYPIGLMLVWIPTSIIGFWGRGAMPDLKISDQILPALVGTNFGAVIAGLALAGILAAIMSSIGSQALTIANLFERDLFAVIQDIPAKKEVMWGRIIMIVILAVVYLLALARVETIVQLGEIAFTGYALLGIPLMIGFYWRRANAAGAWGGILFGFFGFWGFLLDILPEMLLFGFQPIIPLSIGQLIVVGVIPFFTPQPSAERVEEYFSLFEHVW